MRRKEEVAVGFLLFSLIQLCFAQKVEDSLDDIDRYVIPFTTLGGTIVLSLFFLACGVRYHQRRSNASGESISLISPNNSASQVWQSSRPRTTGSWGGDLLASIKEGLTIFCCLCCCMKNNNSDRVEDHRRTQIPDGPNTFEA